MSRRIIGEGPWSVECTDNRGHIDVYCYHTKAARNAGYRQLKKGNTYVKVKKDLNANP